jgi:hypothetical protein
VTQLEILKEILEMWEGDNESDTESLRYAIENYYGNLMDDLHDSRGDSEYQQGVLERMAATEKLIRMTRFDIRLYTQEEVSSETSVESGETSYPNDGEVIR